MKGRWLAPGELKHLYQQDKLQGIYIPYWTFDADADVNYRAEGGRDRQVTRKDKDGKDLYGSGNRLVSGSRPCQSFF